MQFIYRDENGWQLGKYLEHLVTISAVLPVSTREFAMASWHYDITHVQCPHDSWLTSLTITESHQDQGRFLDLTAKFLGAHHDGFFQIAYKDVKSYSLQLETTVRKVNNAEIGVSIGHGDWIIDEVLVHPAGLVSHEIQFELSGHWEIVCADIVYEWLGSPH